MTNFFFELRVFSSMRSICHTSIDLSEFNDIINPHFSFCSLPEEKQRLWNERMTHKHRNFFLNMN